MRFNISVKRVICFLLAVLMLISVIGCKENKKKKPQRVIIREQVVVRDNNDDTTSVDSSKPIDKVEDVTTRAKRELLKAEEEAEKIPFDTLHKEEYAPEFEYKNVSFAGNLADYTIVYSNNKDKNGAPTNARVLAEKLATFFKDNDNVMIPVREEKEVTGKEKMIIVGDISYYKSSLSEKEFAVNLKGDNIVFEGGHIVMVEKAVDWFRTIKREKGKIATLSGKQDDFVSTLTLDGNKYIYVWGDEFDGDELVDNSKWKIGDHMPQWSDLEYLANEDVCYVKDGRLRMTVIRHLSEDKAEIGWASCGSYDTETSMAFRNGYLEFDAKISYTQGIIMPLWLMSNADAAQHIPREQYGAAWTLEFDIFETFSNGDTWDVSIHKYYKPVNTKVNGVTIDNGLRNETITENGIPYNVTYYNNEIVYKENASTKEIAKDNTVFTTKIVGGWAGWGYITSWRNVYNDKDRPDYDPAEDKKQKYTFTGEELEKLNDSYHRYGLLYTKTGYKMYIDGKCWLERDWDIDWDSEGFDFNNNNGWGYNLWYYLIMNQHPYTPESGYVPTMWIDNFDIPISSYINSVRLYQLPDSIEINTPAYDE